MTTALAVIVDASVVTALALSAYFVVGDVSPRARLARSRAVQR